MMFASREDEGVWRLCIRRGRIIKTQDWFTEEGEPYTLDIKFPSYQDSKACADELNEKVLPDYAKYLDRDKQLISEEKLPEDVMIKMMDIIESHLKDSNISKLK